MRGNNVGRTFLTGRSFIKSITTFLSGGILYWPFGLFLSLHTFASIIFGAMPTTEKKKFFNFCGNNVTKQKCKTNDCHYKFHWLCKISETSTPHQHWLLKMFSAQCESAFPSRLLLHSFQRPPLSRQPLTEKGRSLDCPQTAKGTVHLSLTEPQVCLDYSLFIQTKHMN